MEQAVVHNPAVVVGIEGEGEGLRIPEERRIAAVEVHQIAVAEVEGHPSLVEVP